MFSLTPGVGVNAIVTRLWVEQWHTFWAGLGVTFAMPYFLEGVPTYVRFLRWKGKGRRDLQKVDVSYSEATV